MNAEARFMETLFSGLDNVDRYETEAMQEQAIALIPLDDLAANVSKRISRSQGALSEDDFPDLQVQELMKWFKGSFFKWVDQAPCKYCRNEKTQAVSNPSLARPTKDEAAGGASRVELYRCPLCTRITRFPRLNDPGALLRVENRRGRCGEWANCFCLVCRCLGYEVRWVRDWTDHVWCEVFSEKIGEFVHCDPCEASWNQPLLYSRGWKKNLNYVLAFGRHGIADVTRKYVGGGLRWSEALTRRRLVREQWLQSKLSSLTIQKQALMSDQLDRERWADYYAQEVLQLEAMKVTLDPSGSEGHLPGRQSGSESWRLSRGETEKRADISYTLKDFRVSCSGENGPDECVYCLFDGQEDTKWLDFGFIDRGNSFVEVQYAEPRVLQAYELVSANDEVPRDPAQWTVEGYGEEGKAVIDAVSGARFESRHQRQTFEVEKAKRKPYSRFRFLFQGIRHRGGANSIQLCMLKLSFVEKEPDKESL